MTTFLFLLITGFILIFVEIIMPGWVCGIIGATLLVLSAYFCFNLYGVVVTVYYIIGLLIFLTVLVILAISCAQYLPFRKKLFLSSTQEGINVTISGLQELVGKEGRTMSMLRPTGKVLIDGKRYDAMTEGIFLEKDIPVKVIRVESNQVIVRSKTT